MPNKTKRTLNEVLEAIRGSDGVKVVILERLGVSRRTLDTYLERWTTAREAFEHEKEIVGDMAEAIIFGNLHLLLKKQRAQGNTEPVDTSDAWRYLQYRGRERGYATTQRNEHTGAGGKPIEVIDFTKLSTEQLEKIARGGDIADALRGDS